MISSSTIVIMLTSNTKNVVHDDYEPCQIPVLGLILSLVILGTVKEPLRNVFMEESQKANGNLKSPDGTELLALSPVSTSGNRCHFF